MCKQILNKYCDTNAANEMMKAFRFFFSSFGHCKSVPIQDAHFKYIDRIWTGLNQDFNLFDNDKQKSFFLL